MAFKYDFDMFPSVPETEDRQSERDLNDGATDEASPRQVARFRDPELVDALRMADEEVKSLFVDSGFGLKAHDSGVPEGRYLRHEDAARNACVLRLSQNIASAENLKNVSWGGFDPLAFVASFRAAKPIDEVVVPVPETAPAEPEKKSSLMRVGLMAGGALIMMSTAGILIGSLGG